MCVLDVTCDATFTKPCSLTVHLSDTQMARSSQTSVLDGPTSSKSLCRGFGHEGHFRGAAHRHGQRLRARRQQAGGSDPSQCPDWALRLRHSGPAARSGSRSGSTAPAASSWTSTSPRAKPDLAESIARQLGMEWSADCWSAGQTITLTGLNRLLSGVHRELGKRKRSPEGTAPRPARSKLEAVVRISSLTQGRPQTLGPGSKERKSVLTDLASGMGLPVDPNLSKPSLAEAIVREARGHVGRHVLVHRPDRDARRFEPCSPPR